MKDAWITRHYEAFVESYRQRGWDVPPLGDPGTLDAQNVIHAMSARLLGRPPLVVKRGPGLRLRDADANRSR